MGKDAVLWSAAHELALTLRVSLPSPCSRIRGLCNNIMHVCQILPSLIPRVTSPSVVVPLSSLSSPLPLSHLYVGRGNSSFPIRPSPWANPFSVLCNDQVESLSQYIRYINLRPDSDYVLSLVTKSRVLVCDCPTSPCICHALYLSQVGWSCDDVEMQVADDCNDYDSWDYWQPLTQSDEICSPCFEPTTAMYDMNETIRSSLTPPSVPRGPGITGSWSALIAQVRLATTLMFWELFAGTAVLHEAMKDRGWTCAPPIDILFNADYDMMNPLFMAVLIGLILEGRFALIHVGPPCSSFSWAVNRFKHCAMRSWKYPQGFPNLPPHRKLKVELGNALAYAALSICRAQERAGHVWQWEQPHPSLMLALRDVSEFISRSAVFEAIAWICFWGAPWAKPTVILANHMAVMGVNRGCPKVRHKHTPLTGCNDDGVHWTKIAGPYWGPFAKAMATQWDVLKDGAPIKKTTHIAGWAHGDVSSSLEQIIEDSDFCPSGGRDAAVIAKRVAAGQQPSRRALPTLLPEGLGPEAHLQLSQSIIHPFVLPPTLPEHCEYAVKKQEEVTCSVTQNREEVGELLKELAVLCKDDSVEILGWVHPLLQPVVAPRNVAFLREMTWITAFPDLNFVPHYVFGFDTIGWAMPAPTFVQRTNLPEKHVGMMWDDIDSHNARIRSRVKSSGDEDLDLASWVKTKAEFEVGSLVGPFYSIEDLPLDNKMFRLLRRFPIWELHGGAKDKSCRNIDDALAGGQNSFIGLQYTNRPADLDAVIALIRVFVERFPGVALLGTTSDFKSAYRQATANPDTANCWVVALWDPETKKPCYAVAAAQLFGSSSAPLNFCRIPDWCAFISSRVAWTAMIHCIDDLIFFEQRQLADSGYRLWRLFADCCGWDIPDEKSPPPEPWFRVLGAVIDLTRLPWQPAQILVAEDRKQKLLTVINEVISSKALGSALAGQLFGQLGFTCSQFFGRWGRAKLRPLSRRQHESHRFALNAQLMSALHWWLKNLHAAPPRQVFTRDTFTDLVITYSDGEGKDAGVAIAAWSPSRVGKIPMAGFMEIPQEVRRLWANQRAKVLGDINPEDYKDIMEIEGIAPLLILHNWPWVVRDALWIHFIDNNSALGALIKGSSSVNEKDIIVGHTWAQIAKLQTLPWFDRVDSKSNPVDGLSRKDFSGDWNWTPISFPKYVIRDLRAAQESSGQ